MIRSVRCPKCGKRVMDKTDGTTGVIEIICPHCKKTVIIRLERANGGSIRYRLMC
ncbi:MAG: hypothetical protein K5756_05060 [Clostridiales bacterium]|nr:hypothetical protein [Clostridiales bacterium]